MTEKEKVLYHATICFLVRDDQVLLPIKKRKIGAGKRNGYGGGIEEGQTIIENAIDEVRDESNGLEINPTSIEQVARVYFHNVTEDDEKFCCKCEILLIKDWSGEPKDSDEMIDPQWFQIDNLPINEMMLADSDWIPLALDTKTGPFEAHAYYGPRQAKLTKPTTIHFVDSL